MSISRRQFFRGFSGQGENRQDAIKEVRKYVRSHFLPYDFALTDDQVTDVLDAAVAGIDIDADGGPFTEDQLNRLRLIAEDRVHQYREEYLRAEDTRRAAIPLAMEFLSKEAAPEDLQRLRDRFQVPNSDSLEEEIERQIRAWISPLANSRLAACSGNSLRELVFSEIRSWC